jgi:hypothetical protein
MEDSDPARKRALARSLALRGCVGVEIRTDKSYLPGDDIRRDAGKTKIVGRGGRTGRVRNCLAGGGYIAGNRIATSPVVTRSNTG